MGPGHIDCILGLYMDCLGKYFGLFIKLIGLGQSDNETVFIKG